MLCLGFTYASTVPYQAIVGVKQLQFSEGAYAALIAIAAIVGTAGSLFMGFLSDLVADRKRLILFALATGAVGYGLFAVLPSQLAFVACLLLAGPFSGSVYIQLYSAIRAITVANHPQDVVSINSSVRSIYALSWILLPGLVSLLIAARNVPSDAYGVAALAFAGCYLLYAIAGISGGSNATQKLSGWPSFKAALGEVMGGRVFPKVMSLSMIGTIHAANASMLPLFVLTLDGGSVWHVGVLAGMVALLEIPFMIWGGHLSKHRPLWKIIAAAGIIYGFYFASLSLATSVWHIYALSLLNAAGAAIMLTLHVSYFQDLLPDKPGLGTSINSVSSLICKGLGAAVFALAGTAIGFRGAVTVGALIALAGSFALVIQHRGDRL
jgi:hypothetical protein